MKQRPRIYYTATQRELMWDRWQKGDNLHQKWWGFCLLSVTLSNG